MYGNAIKFQTQTFGDILQDRCFSKCRKFHGKQLFYRTAAFNRTTAFVLSSKSNDDTESFQQKYKPHKLLRKETKTRGNHS